MASDIQVVTIGLQGPTGAGLGSHESSATLEHITVCTSSSRPTANAAGAKAYETDTNRTIVWNGSAWKYEPYNSSFVVATWNGVAQNVLDSADTSVKFDTHVDASPDVAAIHNNATNQERFIAPVAGIYVANVAVEWDTNSAGGYRQATLLRSSGAILRRDIQAARTTLNSEAVIHNLSAAVKLGAGDYVYAQTRHNAGTTRTLAVADATNTFKCRFEFVQIATV